MQFLSFFRKLFSRTYSSVVVSPTITNYGSFDGLGLAFTNIPFCNAKVAVVPKSALAPIKSQFGFLSSKQEAISYLAHIIDNAPEEGFQIFIISRDSSITNSISTKMYLEKGMYRSSVRTDRIK